MRYVRPSSFALLSSGMNPSWPHASRLSATALISASWAIALALPGLMAPAAVAQVPNRGDRGQTGTLEDDFPAGEPSDELVSGANRAFPDFRSTGRSGNRVGGASRSGGSCVRLAEEALTPLAPVEAGYGGRTLQAHPTIWVYVPYLLTADSPITFSLLDKAGDTVYQSTFTTEMGPGMVSLTLPPSITLQEGEVYDWYFLVYCNDPQRQDVPAFASGWIERVSLVDEAMADQLDEMSAGDRSEFYARELLWYDALTTLGDALRATPTDAQLVETWNWLLGLPSVKLEEFVDAEIIPCCQMEDEAVSMWP